MNRENKHIYKPLLPNGDIDREILREYLVEFPKHFLYLVKGDNLQEYNVYFSRFMLHDAPTVFERLQKATDYRAEYIAMTKTFAQCMKSLYEAKDWNRKKFMEQTLLTPELFSRTQKEEKFFTRRILVTVIIALDVGYDTACRLLELQGYVLVLYDKVQGAYDELLREHAGDNILDCNKILLTQGIKKKDLLGDRTI